MSFFKFFKTEPRVSHSKNEPSSVKPLENIDDDSFDLYNMSSTLLLEEMNKMKSKEFTKILCFHKRKVPLYSPEELELRIEQLQKACLTHKIDSYELHLLRCKGLKLFEEFLKRTTPSDITIKHIQPLVWSSVSCVHHFYIRLFGKREKLSCIKRAKVKQVAQMFDKLLDFLKPFHDNVVGSVIEFITEGKIWYDEFVAIEILKLLMFSEEECQKIIAIILNIYQSFIVSDNNYADQILTVTSLILKKDVCLKIDEKIIDKILNMYWKSIYTSDPEHLLYAQSNACLESFLTIIIKRLSIEEQLDILKVLIDWISLNKLESSSFYDFGCHIERITKLITIDFYYEFLKEIVFLQILNLITSNSKYHSLLGNRIFQHLMDRNSNKKNFETPKIFFKDLKYPIKVKTCSPCDVYFIENFKKIIQETFMTSARNHGTYKTNLESIYMSICILVVEVPCSCTAAVITCLLMAWQEYVISDLNIESNVIYTNRIHATIISIISLICWVNKADVLYEYVYSVMELRASKAPHLNPPLRKRYPYAKHHGHVIKLGLIFEHWDLRYGLWKCFRTSNRKRSTVKRILGEDSNSYYFYPSSYY